MPPARHRDVEADLHELHSRVLARHGALVAAGRYWIEVVLLLMWRPWRRRHGEDHRRGSRFESLVHDIRYGLRGLRHNPGYAAAAVVTLALGIGVNTAMFTLVNGVVLKGLPVPEPDRLAMVWEVSPSGSRTVAAAANYADWRDSTEAFSELAIVSFWELTLLDPEIPVSLNGGEVSANFLDVMGLEPALGRDVTSADEQDGAERTAWLSHGLWQNMYAADTNVIGRAITLEEGVYTVVGVMPPELDRVGFARRIWRAIRLEADGWLEYRGRHNVLAIGRLATGIELATAQAELAGIAERLEIEYPTSNEGYGVAVQGLKEFVVGSAAQPLLMLFGAVGLVLLIACANVANLTLARSASRRGELAMHAAMGASYGRIVRKLLTESGLVALLGTAVGVGCAYAGLDLLRGFLPTSLPRTGEITIDGSVLAFACATGIGSVLLAGLAPTLQASASVRIAELAGTRTVATFGRSGFSAVLVATEFALAVVLMLGASLFLRSLASLSAVDLGVRTSGTATVTVALPDNRFPDATSTSTTLHEILDRIAALPGVEVAAGTSHLPLSGSTMRSGFAIEGGPEAGAGGPAAHYRVVTPSYFDVLEIPLVRGRGFDRSEGRRGVPVLVVNEAAARRYWPDREAVGARISFEKDDEEQPIWSEIVGVVADVHHFGPASEPEPEMYQSSLQANEGWGWFGRSMTFIARSSESFDSLAPALQNIVHDVDPQLPTVSVNTLDSYFARTVSAPRFNSRLLLMFSLLTLGLSAVGVFAVISFAVRSRTREIGVRKALGESEGRIVRSVVASGLRLALIGGSAGLLAGVLLGRFVESMLFAVSPLDPASYAATAATLGAVAVLASYVPARRAARVDPADALRG